MLSLCYRLLSFHEFGVPAWRIVCDPGLGFGKLMNLEAGLSVTKHAAGLVRAQCFGFSRKRMVSLAQGTGGRWHVAEKTTLPGNLAISCLLREKVRNPTMLRIHDVAEVRRGLNCWDVLAAPSGAGGQQR